MKVACGDLFNQILTVEGDVYTWGYNLYGQLGLKDEKMVAILEPTRVDFGKEKIMDIAVGYNHSLALTTKG